MAAERCGRDVWEPRVRAYQNSGMTQKQWCAENDIKVRALAYWIKKLRDEEMECDFPEWLRINAQDRSPIVANDICSYDARFDYLLLEFLTEHKFFFWFQVLYRCHRTRPFSLLVDGAFVRRNLTGHRGRGATGGGTQQKKLSVLPSVSYSMREGVMPYEYFRRSYADACSFCSIILHR